MEQPDKSNRTNEINVPSSKRKAANMQLIVGAGSKHCSGCSEGVITYYETSYIKHVGAEKWFATEESTGNKSINIIL